MNQLGELNQKNERDQYKIADYYSILKALDVMFGVVGGSQLGKEETRSVIIEAAKKASKRQFGAEEGVDIWISQDNVKKIENRLGREKMLEYLRVYKEELLEKTISRSNNIPNKLDMTREFLEKRREEAREKLFGEKTVGGIDI